jgi:hypothetical protein
MMNWEGCGKKQLNLFEALFHDWPQMSEEGFENFRQDGQDYPNTG